MNFSSLRLGYIRCNYVAAFREIEFEYVIVDSNSSNTSGNNSNTSGSSSSIKELQEKQTIMETLEYPEKEGGNGEGGTYI